MTRADRIRERDTAGNRPRVLLTVSGVIPPDVVSQVDDGRRPRPDYIELARAMDADLLDLTAARRRAGRLGGLIERLGGAGTLLAWACFLERHRYDSIFTDGEQVGLPLAFLCGPRRRRRFAHVMIVHILSVKKKAIPFRLLRLGRNIDTMLVYSTRQGDFIRSHLGVPEEHIVWTPFMVDTEFFAAGRVRPRPRRMICAAGLEWRDYPTLMAAVRDLDLDVVIAAASPWSKHTDTTESAERPVNVEVCSLGFVDLRQLYADALFVVMPLAHVEFQAGVTTILEAMAMGKAVICSRTPGQTDVIDDGVTGVYVTPEDSEALRREIVRLLDDPARAEHLGTAARRYVEDECEVSVYADRLASLTRQVVVG